MAYYPSFFLLALVSGTASPLVAQHASPSLAAQTPTQRHRADAYANGRLAANIPTRSYKVRSGKREDALLSYRGTAIESGDTAANRLLASWIVP